MTVELKLLTANIGSYPRVGDLPSQQRLRWAYSNWEKGKLSNQRLEKAYQEATREVIQEQVQAGLDVVTDGHLRWYDPLSHFAKKMEGCESNGLLRFFDTNFYFRQPVITGKIRWKEPIIEKEFLFAKDNSPTLVRPVVTGPYTLAKYSIDEYYGDLTLLAMDFAEVIGMEVNRLSLAGAEEIQMDEPAILQNPSEVELLSETTEKVNSKKGKSRLLIHVYFGDSAPLYDEMQELPIDALGLDFTYSPQLPDLIVEKGSDKDLGLGLIDARNTRMEAPEEIVPIVKRVLSRVDSEVVYLNPSSGIEYLPRKEAFEKLKNMVSIAEKVKRESGIA